MESEINNGMFQELRFDWPSYARQLYPPLIDTLRTKNCVLNYARQIPATDWYPENCFKNCVLIDQVMHDSYTRHWLIPWELFQELRFDWPSYARQLYPPLITLRTVSRTGIMHDSYTRHWLIPWELFQELRFDWPSYGQLYPPLIDKNCFKNWNQTVIPATDWYPENCFKNCVLIDQVMHDSYNWLIPWNQR